MKQIILAAILIFGTTNLSAQKTDTKKQLFPVHVAVMHESASLPFITNPVKYEYNPAILIGTEYLLKKKNNHDFHLSANLGYYYHKDWESTLFTEVRFGYRYTINRFSISPDIGIGYAHIFNPKPVYGYENGSFKEIKDNGRSAFQSSISLTPSYKLSQKENATEMYLVYTFSFQYPFTETNGFHQFVGVGCKFHPFKNR